MARQQDLSNYAQSNPNGNGYGTNNAPGNPYGFGGMPAPGNYNGAPVPPNPKNNGKKKSKKKLEKERQRKAERKARALTLRTRQTYAIQNSQYRTKVEAVSGRGGIENSVYRLPEDKKLRKGKDYFFVMRKFVCFLMCIVLLISVAYFALGFIKLDMIPPQFIALFVETEKKATTEGTEDEETGDETEGETDKSAPTANADGTTEGEEGTEGEGDAEGETTPKKTFDGKTYGVMDPIFGFLKFVGNKLNIKIDLGESPLYDEMISKVETGMTDPIAEYVVYAFPVALILYLITALIMMLKAFVGMFGRRIVKNFGLGSIFMILFGALTAFGGLAYLTDVSAKMDYAKVVEILINFVLSKGGFAGGYGLLILIALPVIVLILSMFARKKIPYSIFDTYD